MKPKRHVIGEGYPMWPELDYWVITLTKKPGGRKMARLKYIPKIEYKKCRFILEEIPVKGAKRGKK